MCLFSVLVAEMQKRYHVPVFARNILSYQDGLKCGVDEKLMLTLFGKEKVV
jgi:hypothetical protein